MNQHDSHSPASANLRFGSVLPSLGIIMATVALDVGNRFYLFPFGSIVPELFYSALYGCLIYNLILARRWQREGTWFRVLWIVSALVFAIMMWLHSGVRTPS
jgi:hypothetical protein